MINNKGQSIVVFVLIMPIIFLLIGILWEIGNQYVLESEYESEIKNAITYGLKTNNKEDLENKLKIMLDKNLEGTKEISISDDKIKIHVSKKNNSIFKKILKKEFEINLTYIGEIQEGKINLVKE